MSEEVTPSEVEAITRSIDEDNYSITRTFYQIRKKNYIINCDFIQDVLGPMMESKTTRSDTDIKIAACAWANPATRAAAEITYGHISHWKTGQVTNMEKLFCGAIWNEGDANMQSFNDDISRWDVSNVTTMKYMFQYAFAFGGDLSRWDTSNVTTMEFMFGDARAFNGDLSRWDTSKVTTVLGMFQHAYAFNGDLSRWDTSSVITMDRMFQHARIFNGDVSRWDVSNVTTLEYMFHDARAFVGDLSRWDSREVTSAYYLFRGCPNGDNLNHKPPEHRWPPVFENIT